jgi:hypothetical protein
MAGDWLLSINNNGLNPQRLQETTVPYGTSPESMYNVHDNINDLIVRYCLAIVIYLMRKQHLLPLYIEEQPT